MGGGQTAEERAPESGCRRATLPEKQVVWVNARRLTDQCDVQEHPTAPSRRSSSGRPGQPGTRTAVRQLATSRSNRTGACSPSSAASSRVREHDQSHERSDSGVNSVFGRATGGWWAGNSFPTFPGKAHSCQGSVEKLLHARSIELWPKPRQLVRLGLFDGWQLVHRTQL